MKKTTIYQINPLAHLVPMASPSELEALKLDIKANGQREPALLWNNKLVDGRNRQLACQQLGIELKVKNLDPLWREDQVASLVKSLNTRRNLTETQKVMCAVKAQQTNGGSNEHVAKNWGISERTFKNGKYIAKERPELVEDLREGKSVKIFDHIKDLEISTNKINTLARLIKVEHEKDHVKMDESEAIDLSFSVDSLIKTEAAKQWFYEKQKGLNITNHFMLLDYIEFANLKFKAKSPAT